MVNEYNNLITILLTKSLYADADYSHLTKEIESSPKAPKFKVGERIKISKYKNIFSKGCTRHSSREIFMIDFMLKTNPWTYKIKDLNK